MNLVEYLKERKTPPADPVLNKRIASLWIKDVLETKTDDELVEDVKKLKKAEKNKDLLKIPFFVYKKIVKDRQEDIDAILHPISSSDAIYVVYSLFVDNEREIMRDIPYGEDYIIYFDNYLYHLYNQGNKLTVDNSIMASDTEFKKLRMRDYYKVVKRYTLKDGKLNVREA